MATFPYNDATFVLDSLLQEGGLTPSFSAYPHPPPPQGIGCHCALEITNETPITDKSKTDSSSMVLELHSDGPKENSIGTKRKNSGGSCLSSAQSQDKRGTRTKKQRKCSTRKEEKGEGEFLNKDQKEPPTGYIHVRARRGQATDSHSLAERVRREKISERMKLLQGLVPGSDKVTGKAHMLDEIINYVQSLQYQVEFLSMKLASANPVLHDFGRDVNALMVEPESMIASSPLPSNLSQPTAFADMKATSTAKHKYSHQNNLLPLLPQQAHMLSAFSQDDGNLPWDALYDQRQRLLNQYSFNNLC